MMAVASLIVPSFNATFDTRNLMIYYENVLEMDVGMKRQRPDRRAIAKTLVSYLQVSSRGESSLGPCK